MDWRLSGPFAFFDLETTGMSPTRDRILEIGAVRLDKDGSISRFSSLVNPRIPVPERITSVTGITNEMIADAPSFHDVGFKFLEFCRGCRMVAHNARFDLAFMQESLARHGMPLLPNGAYDSIPIIRRAYPGLSSYSMQSLMAQLPVCCQITDDGSAHRAAYDAEALFVLFRMSMNILCGTPEQDTTP